MKTERCEVVGTLRGEIEDGKRLQLPGVQIKSDCPRCGHTRVFDIGGDNYLSYPKMNEEFVFGCYCHDCDGAEGKTTEWVVTLRLDVALVAVNGGAT